jgi:hypothetical protein
MAVIDLITALKGLYEGFYVLNNLKVLVLQIGLLLEFTNGAGQISL